MSDRPLYQRIAEAEALAKEGKKVDEIISLTGLARVTAQCVVGRVRGGFDPSRLTRNELDEEGRRMRLMIMGKDAD